MPTPLEQLNQLDSSQVNSSGLQGLMNMIKNQEPNKDNPITGQKAEGYNGIQPTPPSIKPQQFNLNLPNKYPVMSFQTRQRLGGQSAVQPSGTGLVGLLNQGVRGNQG